MSAWEYKFIDTYRGQNVHGSPVPDFEREMREAGAAGWEAVGPVALSYVPSGRVSAAMAEVGFVMLKRPKAQ